MSNYDKVFVIGCNKTGTCSVTQALKDLNFNVGNQHEGSILLNDYLNNKFDKLINFSKKHQAFQDVPFSCPNTYKVLDEYFPKAKFILTIRNNSEQWYKSLVNYHAQMLKTKNIPTYKQLKNSKLVSKGWMYLAVKGLFKTPDNDLYNKKMLIEYYENHNKDVINYFSDKPGKLLIINLSEEKSYKNFCNFLAVNPKYEHFPYLNKTKKIII